jgi:hypothetical protein
VPKLEDATQALRKDLNSHDGRIEELRHLVEIAEDEIAIHEAVLELGRNERLVSAINEFGSSDSGLRNEIPPDFAQYCTEQEIPIPAGVSFVPVGADDEPLPLKAEVRRGRAVMEIIWAPDIGFVGSGLIPQLSFIINAPS